MLANLDVTDDFIAPAGPGGGQGPLAQWEMNDNANDTMVIDSSGNGYHGTSTRNTSEMYTSGQAPGEGALAFDGTGDYVNCGNIQGMLGASKTYIFRVLPASVDNSVTSGIICKNPVAGAWNGLTIGQVDNDLRVWVNG